MLCDNNQPEFGGESVVCTRMKFSGLERLVSVVKCICWFTAFRSMCGWNGVWSIKSLY